jgi:hypothetical protein
MPARRRRARAIARIFFIVVFTPFVFVLFCLFCGVMPERVPDVSAEQGLQGSINIRQKQIRMFVQYAHTLRRQQFQHCNINT